MSNLNDKLEELKKYSQSIEFNKLNKRIYALNFDEIYLKYLTQDTLQYIHIKLHNALSYKRPFAPFDKLKIKHDLVVKFLKNHKSFDKLDSK